MSLKDTLATPIGGDARRPRGSHPKGMEPGIRYTSSGPSEVVLQLTEIPEDEQRWRSEITRVTSLTIPDDRQVLLSQVRYWGDPRAPYVYCRFLIEDRPQDTTALDVEALIRATRRASAPRPPKNTTDRALVVAWADLQVGKVGSRGDTETLVSRVMDKLAGLEQHVKALKPRSVYLIDCGDCVESFENTGQQAFTNDLSFPEQLRVARRLFTEAVVRLAKLAPEMVVASVPSNHGRWRRGKDQLGRPGDDFGIETLVAVADACAMNPDAFGHVSFRVPDPWEETIAFDVHGTILAVAHGHQVNRPNGIPQWWANQVHGGQPAADADVLLTGHFHHLRVEPTGRSAHTGRAKWWLQAPTLDNSSDWFRYRAGSDSDPGLLTFTVDSNGWDHLKVL